MNPYEPPQWQDDMTSNVSRSWWEPFAAVVLVVWCVWLAVEIINSVIN